jgi:choloylglycine hydrolase
MCTAISFLSKDHYFGRNLDLEYSYAEKVTITPRHFPLQFRHRPPLSVHYAMIGMATVAEGYPLYYEATNEKGLSMAGLNFPGNAFYHPPLTGKDNIASFEFIPWILGQCDSVEQAKTLLECIQLTDTAFNDTFAPSPLHWMICDRNSSLVVESMQDGLHVYEDPVGVLTNNPPFPYHMHRLSDYIGLSREEPKNSFSAQLELKPYSRGMGAMGLPGDLSSSSRFVRAAFTKLNSVCEENEAASVSQFFHILASVAQQNGCVRVNGAFEKTLYSSCCNTDQGIYYYTTYNNSQITAIRMLEKNMKEKNLTTFQLVDTQQIHYEN